MTPVAIVAIADIVLIASAVFIVVGSRASQRRELRKHRALPVKPHSGLRGQLSATESR